MTEHHIKVGSPLWNERGDYVVPSISYDMEGIIKALEAVEGAMLSGGDGIAGDFGWSITKLNRARPLIRAALAGIKAGRELGK